jgi:TPR repeat protein
MTKWPLVAAAGAALSAVPIVIAVGLSRDRRAARIDEAGCRAGDVAACERFADRLSRGVGVRADHVRADELRVAAPRMRACEGGEARACVQIAALWEAPHALAIDTDHARAMRARGCALGEVDGCLAILLADLDGGVEGDARTKAEKELMAVADRLVTAKDPRALATLEHACTLAIEGSCLLAARQHPAIHVVAPGEPSRPSAPPSFPGSPIKARGRRALLADAPTDDLAASAGALLEKGCAQGDRFACLDRITMAMRAGAPEDVAAPWFSRIAQIDASRCAKDDLAACGRLVEVAGPPVSEATRKDAETRIVTHDEASCGRGDVVACRRFCAALGGTDKKRVLSALDLACRAKVAGACAEACALLGDGEGDAAARASYGRMALSLYDEGCAQGDAKACLAAGRARALGSWVPADGKRAAADLARGCTLGELTACCEAGLALEAIDAASAKEMMDKAGGRAACAPEMH